MSPSSRAAPPQSPFVQYADGCPPLICYADCYNWSSSDPQLLKRISGRHNTRVVTALLT